MSNLKTKKWERLRNEAAERTRIALVETQDLTWTYTDESWGLEPHLEQDRSYMMGIARRLNLMLINCFRQLHKYDTINHSYVQDIIGERMKDFMTENFKDFNVPNDQALDRVYETISFYLSKA